MTYLLLQTFVLLLASYFFGAIVACVVKRAIFGTRSEALVRVAAPATMEPPLRPSIVPPKPIRQRIIPPPVVPRSIDPVQPRIDVLRRPEPRPVPKLIDPSRFERALMGPDPNEGMPRISIPEICPAVLMPVTGEYRPGTYGPPPPEPILEPEPAAEMVESVSLVLEPLAPPEEAIPEEGIEIEDPPAPPVERPKRISLTDATTAAAAAAVAAAKAAAAASVGHALRMPAREPEKIEDQSEQSLQPNEDLVEQAYEEQENPPDTHSQPEIETPPIAEVRVAEAPVANVPIEGGDDFQRIRAIDAELEQRLKLEGVHTFEHIAEWNAADVKRITQALGIPGRIDREQWVEQAQILAKGGETYYSRNRAARKAVAPDSNRATAEGADGEATQSPTSASETSQSQSWPADVANEPAAPSSQAMPTPVTVAQLSGVAAASQGRSVAEMAAAAAAAIAAASASVTRGLKPIEPISPLSKVDPKISMPAKLSDAIKEKEAASAVPSAVSEEVEPPRPLAASRQGPHDDLKRIRGVGVLIEKRLNAMGISHYEQIANWTSGEIDRVSQVLEFKGRIERESWVEQARILLNGGQTEFSRRVDRGEVDTSRET